MDHLYLEAYKFNSNSKTLDLPLEAFIIYFVYRHCRTNKIILNFVLSKNDKNESTIAINITNDRFSIMERIELPEIITYCILPSVLIENVKLISGLSSVARQLIKSTETESIQKLLGFRDACLMACNESSIWTKFCEIDMIQTMKQLLRNTEYSFKGENVFIPRDLTRFECHMSCPVRIHNVYKIAQEQAKIKNKNVADVNTKIPKEQLDLEHSYAEGPCMTLSDLILYPLIHFTFVLFGNNIFQLHLPLTYNWYRIMSRNVIIPDVTLPFDHTSLNNVKNVEVVQEITEKQSLYISDPERYKPRNRIYTKQSDILNALNLMKSIEVKIEEPFGSDLQFDWNQIPIEANPEGGALPQSRMKRKCEQLENLTKSVLKIAKPGHTIVDFCSGSGHLGILLAVKLPACKIILLENKERSLHFARLRIARLELTNVILVQSNLDYFIGRFDIGSLHACGVATDLVIQKCLEQSAAFISCPCCYGGVHNCHHITYPRSRIFRNSELTSHDYLVLGHAADQTHDVANVKTEQGVKCMNLIDTDRKLLAEEFGYRVILAKMIPETCTPKNNILVGLPKKIL